MRLLLAGRRMTAEIAVINRLAVALAADSAVTIGEGRDAKIFQTENKVFELSDTKPVGLMIYNSTQFFGVPWEIIIKDFRSKYSDVSCGTVFDWPRHFFQYISDTYPAELEMVVGYWRRATTSEFRRIHERFINEYIALTQPFQRTPSKKDVERLSDSLYAGFNKIVDEHVERLDQSGIADTLINIDFSDFFKNTASAVDELIDDLFGMFPLRRHERDKLQSLFRSAVLSKSTSELSTGLVFADFGAIIRLTYHDGPCISINL